MTEAIRLYREWAKEQPQPEPAVLEAGDEPDAGSTLEEAQEQARSEIEAHLLAMNPYEFQDLIASLLRAMDYHVDWVAPPGADDGNDIIAFADPLGARGPRIRVQVKRHQSKADVDALRAFMAVMKGDDVGIYVDTGGFTKDAGREARRQQSTMTLWDLARVIELWIEYYDRIAEADRARLLLTPVFYLSPSDHEA
jgi:restriction system protein